MTVATDLTLRGRRIVFLFSTDPYTELKQGDRGTVQYERYNDVYGADGIHVRWDSGSTLSLIRDHDAWHVLREDNPDTQ